jgi:hypothetical protein
MFASKDIFLTAPSGGYIIGKSVRIRSSATAYFSKTLTTATNNKIWTFSSWVKRGTLSTSGGQTLMEGYAGGSTLITSLAFSSNGAFDRLELQSGVAGVSAEFYQQSVAVYRDPANWYHIVVAVDTTQTTASNRVKMYVNGSQITTAAYGGYNQDPSQNYVMGINSAIAHKIGGGLGAGNFDGYMADTYFIDGQQLTPSSFGSTNGATGVWQPIKYTGTFGTNGFYLNYSDNSAVTTSSNVGIGKDFSGNANYWTSNNISVTTGTTYDSMLDVPTISATSSNYAVMNFLNKGSNGTGPADGNLSWGAGGHASCLSTIGVSSGKWYAEFTLTTSSAGGFGITSNQGAQNAYLGSIAGLWWIYDNTGSFNINNETTTTFSGASRFTTNQVWQVALDITNGKCFVGVGNSWVDSGGGSTGNPSTGANPTFTFTAGTQIFYMLEVAGCVWAANFGQRAFTNTPPSGYLSVNTYNLPDSTIKNGAIYMAATTFTGVTGGGSVVNTVNGVGFQPDMVWMKARNNANNHELADSVRGTAYGLFPNLTNSEVSDTRVSSFNSNGFSYGTNSNSASTGRTVVGWQWSGGGGTQQNIAVNQYSSGVPSIASVASVNTTSGFSVVTYTGNGSTATVGHGLGVAPNFIIVKSRTSAVDNWQVYHASLGNTQRVTLNTFNAADSPSPGMWNSTSPTSTVFSVGNQSGVNSATTYVAYCFSAVEGYSRFGSFVGNGSSDGSFIYLGFRARWVLIKASSTGGTGYDWSLFDTSRNSYNVANLYLFPNLADGDTAQNTVDIVSNGFKLRSTNPAVNGSGVTYIYACFAENPFKNALSR